jgi:uncharacterized protein (DUF433 family)
MAWRDQIAVDPQILAGKPVVKGTRNSVELVIDLLAAGWTEQQVLARYPTLRPTMFVPVWRMRARSCTVKRCFRSNPHELSRRRELPSSFGQLKTGAQGRSAVS